MEWSLVVAIWTLFHLWATGWMKSEFVVKYFIVAGESVVAGFALTVLNTKDNEPLIIAYAALHASAMVVLHEKMVKEYCLISAAGTLVASVAAFNAGQMFLFGAGIAHSSVTALLGAGAAYGRI